MNANDILSEANNSKNNIITFNNKKVNNEKIHLISVIIPLYNEQNTIQHVIKKIPNHHSYEIIIVDDGSTDDSIKKVKEIKDKEIKIVNHKQNQGYGAAILTGISHSLGDIIITLDSDGQHNPEEIPNLTKLIINNQADIVIGSRYLGMCHYKIPLYTRVGEYIINLFLKILFLQNVYDNQCGFRAFRKELSKILKNMRNTGMGFSTEFLFKAALYQYKIVETPVSINPRHFGTSHVNLIEIIRSIIFCIIFSIFRKLKLNLNWVYLKKIINYFYKKIKNRKLFFKEIKK